jgi:hypothetical protein
MKSDYPRHPTPFEDKEELAAPPFRLLDEKVSDEAGPDAKENSILAPTGLSNPFWN